MSLLSQAGPGYQRLFRLQGQKLFHLALTLAGLPVKCYWETIDQFHCFHVERDVASLSTAELNLTATLIAGQVQLVSDTDEPFAGEAEFSWSAKLLLQEMLERIRELECPRTLVALREGEKVIVFHK